MVRFVYQNRNGSGRFLIIHAVDPADGCTFWFAGEYMGTSGIFNGQTRIASARSPGWI